MTMLSFKQDESNYGKKEHCDRGFSWIIKFSHCFHFGYRKYGIITKKNNAWSEQLLIHFQEGLASLLSVGKSFSSDLEG